MELPTLPSDNIIKLRELTKTFCEESDVKKIKNNISNILDAYCSQFNFISDERIKNRLVKRMISEIKNIVSNE